MILMIYVANYMSKPNNSYLRFKNSFWLLWLPVISIVMLIFPSNFSTAVILLFMVITQMFIGGYPSKYLIYILGFLYSTVFATAGFAAVSRCISSHFSSICTNSNPRNACSWLRSNVACCRCSCGRRDTCLHLYRLLPF